MTVSPEVQAQIDKTRELNDLVQSVHSAMQALTLQLNDIQAKAQAIPVATPGTVSAPAQPGMSEEDKAALVQTVQDTQSVINQLKSDITANTAVDTSSTQGATPPAPVAPNTDPSTVQAPASTAPDATPAAALPTQADGTSAA